MDTFYPLAPSQPHLPAHSSSYLNTSNPVITFIYFHFRNRKDFLLSERILKNQQFLIWRWLLVERLVVGLMSGTSIDGIDAALVRVNQSDPKDFTLRAFKSIAYTPKEREAILRLCQPETATLPEICQMNFRLGELFAQAVLTLLDEARVEPEEVFCIGSHGQTIYHIPGDSTLQIGEPSVIARRTEITTVADFRPADIAAGGQGAPLVPYFDQLIFGADTTTSAVQNIGGIGNVTVVGGSSEKLPWIAFDTGPGNMIMDFMAEMATNGQFSYDKDGLLAAQGVVDEDVVTELLQHPYFSLKPPKSTGRELFGKEYSQDLPKRYSLSPLDWVATATAFTASSIVQQYKKFILPYVNIDRIIIGGGGGQNPTLLQMLRERSGLPVHVHEDFGISTDAKEAIAFALLAHATMEKQTSNVPRATGANQPVVLGKVVYP